MLQNFNRTSSSTNMMAEIILINLSMISAQITYLVPSCHH